MVQQPSASCTTSVQRAATAACRVELLVAALIVGTLVALLPRHALAQQVDEAVVYVECFDTNGNRFQGSGVVVSRSGHVLTARHVIPQNPRANEPCRGSVGVADSSSAKRLNLLPQRDVGFDTAILRFADAQTDYAFLKYCPLNDRMLGKPVFAVGYPAATQTGKPSYRAGIVSTTFVTSDGYIESDILVAPGMSGGPVLADDRGSMIGLVAGAKFDVTTGLPEFYAITPITELNVRGLQLTESEEPCYPQAPSNLELSAQIAALSERLDNSRIETAQTIEEIEGQLDTVAGRIMDLNQSLQELRTQFSDLQEQYYTTASMADRTFESLAGRIENLQRENRELFQEALDEALEGRPIRPTVDEIYENLAKPLWSFTGRFAESSGEVGEGVQMTLSYERQISAPVFSPVLYFCMTPLFEQEADPDLTTAENPMIPQFYELLDERFDKDPKEIRTCDEALHGSFTGQRFDGQSGIEVADGGPTMTLNGEYISDYAGRNLYRDVQDAEEIYGDEVSWNGWYYLQVVRRTEPSDDESPAQHQIVLRAIVDATRQENEYKREWALPCQVFSISGGPRHRDEAGPSAARLMSELISTKGAVLEQNEPCYADPS